ncbi:MAG: glucuronate isomerase [Verrucomicrobia bacterium]|nr:glucuronate isomerase [Verrucomicrobiota bacterium]
MPSRPFIHDDFLLGTRPARELYHRYAKDEPIYDYHCHLPPDPIAKNHQFANLAELWLGGDHYKWRAMRTNGVKEHFVTGRATSTSAARSATSSAPTWRPGSSRTISRRLAAWCGTSASPTPATISASSSRPSLRGSEDPRAGPRI